VSGAARQSVLDFAGPPAAFGRSDFLVSDSNRAALGWIDRWPAWPSSALVLHGPAASGRTHLAHLWCERAVASLVAGPALAGASLPLLVAENAGRVAVDDADRAAEPALLHLYNACAERGGSLLVTAARPAGRWQIGLADLRSRLRAAAAVGIAMPDDALLGAVLLKHFADRQLRVGPELIAYLIGRIERSFAGAATVVAALDKAALAGHQPIAIPLARRIVDQFLSPTSDSAVT
jgi:chromosomal replication initiation ATPase DnaA